MTLETIPSPFNARQVALLFENAEYPPEFEVPDGFAHLPKRVAWNVEELATAGEVGRHLIPAYLAAVEESTAGRVRNAIIRPVNQKFLGGGMGATQRIKDNDFIYVLSLSGWGVYAEFLEQRRIPTAIFAASLDIKAEELSIGALAEFILGHEIGHIEDDSHYSEEVNSARRIKDMESLPFPYKAPSRLEAFLRTPEGLLYWGLSKKKYRAMGINSREELMDAQEIAYRALPTEKNPDQFAVRVMRRLAAQQTAV
jgi:hypothetical protein